MEYLEIPVRVPKETHEVGRELVAFVNDVRKALADGYQHSDLVNIVGSAVARVGAAVEGWDKLPGESKEDLPGVVKSLSLNLAELFVKPEPESKN